MKISHPKPLRYWLRLAIAALLFVLLLYLPVMAYTMVRPSSSEVTGPTPAEWGAAYREVSLSTPDGAALKGWYIPSQNGAVVILLHGYGSNRLQMLWHAQALSEAGFGVLLYDQRASGESGGRWRTWGWKDVDDFSAVQEYIQSDPAVQPGRIGVFGASTGAEIALQAAIRYPQVTAVIADGPGFSAPADLPPLQGWQEKFYLAPVPLVLKLMEVYTGVPALPSIAENISGVAPRPVLLISTGTWFEDRQAQYYLSKAGDGAEYWHIPEAVHTLGFLARPEEFKSRVLQFYTQALLAR